MRQKFREFTNFRSARNSFRSLTQPHQPQLSRGGFSIRQSNSFIRYFSLSGCQSSVTSITKVLRSNTKTSRFVVNDCPRCSKHRLAIN